MKKIIRGILIFVSIATALPYWDQEDLEKEQLILKAKSVM